MRQTVVFSLLLILLAGCGKDDKTTQASRSVSIDDLTVTIREHPRSYFCSDKRGGFLIGTAGRGAEQHQEWSVAGQTLLHDVGSFRVDGKALDQNAIDSVQVTPLEVTRFFHNGIVQVLMPLDQVLGGGEAHGLAVQVKAPSPFDIMFAITPGPEFVSAPQHEAKSILFQRGKAASLAFSAGPLGEPSPDGITVKQASQAFFVIVYAAGDSADFLAHRAQGEVELLRNARRDRMEDLLHHAYLRTSDQELTRALRWLQLSLDGLIAANSETTAVAALPWDGSFNVRDNAIALAGLDVATGNYATTAGILRTIARHPDRSADGGAWFVREAYEHVIASGDTGLARGLYPAVLGDLASNMRRTDSFNFLVSGSGPERGTRTAEQQGLWYYQQTIGSIFAAYLGDSTHAAQWALMAELTSRAFNRLFVDTSRNVVYERITADGRGSVSTGAGMLLCLDMIELETVRQNTIKGVMKALLRPHGIAMSAAPENTATGDGAIQNWMAGQMVYALTRYDCEHISYPVTRRLVTRLLETDMVGALPGMYSANEEARAIGAQASLAAMAEFIRAFYQDYLGVHINMTTRSLVLEPKLPDEIRSVDFTIFAGDVPVTARYERLTDQERVIMRGEGLPDSLRVRFVWMMKNGDAWRGTTTLQPGKTTTLVFGERDATAFFEGKETPMGSMRHLVGFSQRAEMEQGL